MRALIFIFICILWAHPTNAEKLPKWLCIADFATGFSFENGQWVPTQFNVDENKYIIFQKVHSDRYEVIKIGEKIGRWCLENNPDEEGWMNCYGMGEEWRMNIRSLRYMRSLLVGYVIDLELDTAITKEFTPFVEIGKCSPF